MRRRSSRQGRLLERRDKRGPPWEALTNAVGDLQWEYRRIDSGRLGRHSSGFDFKRRGVHRDAE